jgi:hypothetical protein
VIVRVLTARVPEHNVGQFNVLLRRQLDELREQPGLVYAKLARRLEPDGAEELVLFEEWRTPADLWQWTGGRLGRPRLIRGTEELVEDLKITHYEALDMTPDEEGLVVINGHKTTDQDVAGHGGSDRASDSASSGGSRGGGSSRRG